MKKSYLLFLLIISVFMMSCGGHFFNPRYYYNNNSASESEQEKPPEDVGVGSGEDIPENEDPFKVGEWNDIGYKFDGNKILDFLFGASFDGNNVPMYTFFKDGTLWAVSDASTGEKKYNAKDGANKAQGFDITGATFYRYDYKNPLVAPESSYNQSERMQRFLFYRLVGKASVVPLNNYLIAVDTYSKLVFAYGKITKTGDAAGNAYPTAFEAVELHGDKRPFYEYDPIGFMAYDEAKEALTLTLYREYQEEMAVDANKFFPKIHDSSRPLAGYTDRESAGTSPYYKVNIADIKPEDILEQFKGKTYAIRSGLTLYTYIFSEDGKQVTITLDHFYDGKTSEKTYDYVEVTGATSLKYGDITITGLESYAKLKDSVNNVSAELDYVDPGPEFVYRVRGKVYDAEDGSYSYKFNIDGTILSYYKNGKLDKKYIFDQQDASDRAVYKEENARAFWGLRLDEHEGVKDGVLYWSVGAGTSPGGTQTSGVTSTPGYLNADESVIEFFVDAVANKVYAFRDYKGTPGDGRSLKKFSYNFSSDGKTITYIESIPKQEETSVTYTLVEDKGKTAVYSLDGQQYTFTLQSSGQYLYKGEEEAGELNFQDRGAYFLDIVAGTTYYAPDGSYKYVFDASGKNVTYYYPSGKYVTYTITDNFGSSGSDYTKAVYEENGALIFKYWALKINKTGTMIQMSTGALATAGDILNSAAYGYTAYLTEQNGVPVDRFMSAVAGQTYKMRNNDNSVLMQYYTFSSAGNYIAHVVTNTDTGKQTSSNMYYNYQAVDKNVQGIYEEQFPAKQSRIFTLKDSDNELYLENTLVGILNYEDTGLNFVDRVAGKTYKDKNGGYEYRFDTSGKILEYYVNGELSKTYTFEQQDASDRAVYKEGFATFWGLRLADDPDTGTEDGVLYWSGSSWASPETTPTQGVTSTPGYLVVETAPESFIDKLKNNTYKLRDYSGLNLTNATGNSLTLYSYSFNAAADTLTYKAETWKGKTVTVDYTFKEQTETDATYAATDGTTLKVTLQGNEDILYKVNDTARVVTTELGRISFEDKGPLFLDMVRGTSYIAEDKTYKYTFSGDGLTLTFADSKGNITTYNYSKINSSDYTIAAYKEDTLLPRYWGFKLTEEANKVERSTGSLAFADDIFNSALYGDYPAYLGNGDIEMDALFADIVKTKTYKFRDYSGLNSTTATGKSLTLYTYSFNEDGKTLTLKEESWKKEPVQTVYTLSQDNERDGVYTSADGKTINISVENNNSDIIYNKADGSLLGEVSFTDKGPLFLDMVKGATYIAEDQSYKYSFSEDGRTLTYTYPSEETKTYTYNKINPNDYNIASYDEVGSASDWGIRLSENGNKADWSTLALPGGNFTAIYGAYPAYLGDGPLVADKFLNSVGGRVFEVRNSEDSLKLDRYTFSSGGATITYEQVDWYTDEVTTIVYQGYTKINDLKASYSYTDNSGQLVSAEFSIDTSVPTVLSKGGLLAGNANYKDPGPNFVDRVKGKTYEGMDGNTPYAFVFDATAEKVDFYWDGSVYKTYTFADVDYDGEGDMIGSRAIYKQALLTFWGFKLVDRDGKKDAVLYRTGTSYGGPDTTPAENANAYESFRKD